MRKFPIASNKTYSKTDISNLKPYSSTANICMSIWPTHKEYRKKHDDPNYYKYCKVFLMLKKPFNDSDLFYKISDSEDAEFVINEYKDFINSTDDEEVREELAY